MSQMGELSMNDDESSADQAAAGIPVPPADVRQIIDKMDEISRSFDSQRIRVDQALAKLRHAPEAAYDVQGRKGCMENTRVAIFDELLSWSEDPEAPTIFWLSGMAGTGKTSIAYSFCAKLVERKRLGGSFFCSRSAEYSQATRIIPSLAYRLARQIKQFKLLLAEYLDQSDDVSYKQITVQIEDLLRIHFSKLRHSHFPPLVLVIDALDECSDKDAVTDMLNALISAAPNIPIKFFVTSRPDQHIRDTQLADGAKSRILKLHEIHHSLVEHDIRLYLQTRIAEVFARGHSRKPTHGDIEKLVRLSGQLFIFASTAIEYMRVGDSMKRLERLIKLLPSTPQSTKSLYAMYQLIIDDSLRPQDMEEDELESLSEILASVLVSRTALSVQSLSKLLRTSGTTVRRTLDRLHAVLRVPDDDDAPGLSTLHASFEDFLTSPDRVPRELLIDRSTGHRALAQGSFHLMLSQLRFNMCKLPSSYLLDSDVENLLQRVENNILCVPGLEYACRYWTSHLIEVTAGNERAELQEKLENLCQEKILFWIEVMNLLGAKTDCYSGILAVQSWAAQVNPAAKLQMILDAVVRLCSRFIKATTCLSTPHLYISSLATEFGTSSDIPKEWRQLFPRVPRIRCTGVSNYGGALSDIHTTESVNSVAFSPDGAQIVSGSVDKSVRIWDASTGKEVLKLEGHTLSVNSVVFSPDGAHVVSGSWDKSVRIWDASTGKEVQKLEGHTLSVKSVMFSPDGTQVVSGSWDKSVRIWDVWTGKEVQKLKGHTSSINSVAFSPNGAHIVSGSGDKSVRIWDASAGKEVQKLQGHTSSVNSVVFSPDGTHIVSGSLDKSVCIWDVSTGKEVQKLEGHTSSVNSVALSPDGTHIVSGSLDKSVRIWDASTGKEMQKVEGHTWSVSSVMFSPDGAHIVSGSGDDSVRIWDAWTGKEVLKLEGHTSSVNSVAFSPNGAHIVSGSWYGSVRIWDASTGEEVQKLEGHMSSVNSVTFSPNGVHIVSGSDDRSVRIWDASTGKEVLKLEGHTSSVNSVVFSPNGAQIVSGSAGQSVHIWDASTGKEVQKLEGHTKCVNSVAFSPDGTHIVSGSEDCSVRIWDASTGKQGQKLEGHTWPVNSVAFSPDGAYIVSGSYDRSARIWDAWTGKEVQKLEGHTSSVSSVAFSPDGTRIVSSSSDRSVRIWVLLSNVDIDWTCGSNGWIIDQSSRRRLLWLPKRFTLRLQDKYCSVVFSRKQTTILQLSLASLGTNWVRCYRSDT